MSSNMSKFDSDYEDLIHRCDEGLKLTLKKRQIDYNNAIDDPQCSDQQSIYESVTTAQDKMFAPKSNDCVITSNVDEVQKYPYSPWEDFCHYIAASQESLPNTQTDTTTVTKRTVGSSNSSDGAIRRSSRTRIAPVEYWNGVAVKYDDEGTLIGVQSVDEKPTIGHRNTNTRKKHEKGSISNTDKKQESKIKSKEPVIKSNKSSDIDFNYSIISKHPSVEDNPPAKPQRKVTFNKYDIIFI